jgi:hypothetical protein
VDGKEGPDGVEGDRKLPYSVQWKRSAVYSLNVAISVRPSPLLSSSFLSAAVHLNLLRFVSFEPLVLFNVDHYEYALSYLPFRIIRE